MRRTLAALFVLTLTLPARSQEPIRFARTPDISPDGKVVAFSYLGDVWTVDVAGGVARPVTMHPAHDINPVFSPDGKTIAFSSNRHGTYDVFVVPAQGGRPRRLTVDSSDDMVVGWTPDGTHVLFTSNRSTAFPFALELYTVPVGGGQSRRIPTGEGKQGCFSPDGKLLAYVRGPGSWYRKGYRGSSNDDIWVCDADGTNNRRLTTFEGQDTSPMWAPDGKTIYYVSEHFGTPANIVARAVNPADGCPVPNAAVRQVTHHKDEAVRLARLSGNGDWLIYECGFDLYVASTRPGGPAPRKLLIEAYADDKVSPERPETFTNKATEFALSANERHIAFTLHGNLFFMPLGPGGGKPIRLTETSAFDHNIAWAPDSSRILFVSDREGQEDIYAVESDDPEHAKVIDSHRFRVKRLTNDRAPESGLAFSPDGKRVAFLRAGRLWMMNPDGTDPKEVVKEQAVFDYEWSPDSKWVVYARRDGSWGNELYVVPAGGATAENPARNVTRYATWNADVTWSGDGKRLAFLSNRSRGDSALYVLDLRKPAVPGTDKAPSPGSTPAVTIDWDDVHERARLIVPGPVGEAAISPDGSRVAFRTGPQGGDLYVANTDGSQVTRLTSGNLRPHQIRWATRGLNFDPGVIYFLDSSGAIRVARATSGDLVSVPFRARMTINTQDEHTEMFDQGWRLLAQSFYDSSFHGQDWDALRKKYRPVLQHISHKEDLNTLIMLLLGELNASHLGISGPAATPEEVTADLGLLYDETYQGKGLKIAEVIRRGPADRRGLNLAPGDVITHLDGVELTGAVEVSKLLNGKVNEPVTLTVQPAKSGEKPRTLDVQAVGRWQITELMVERWEKNNANRVAGLSSGRLAYVHIPSMDEEGLERFVRGLYSDAADKDGLIIDLRNNGGGFTHDKVLAYLGARAHHVFRQREGGEGLVMRANDRKWNKPLVVLINNRSFSDAEILPSAIRALTLGKLVGQPTGGMVISSYHTQLIDGSNFRIPTGGVFTTQGVNLEKEGVQPDYLVEIHPDEAARGLDPQLDKAVEVLKCEVQNWKKTNPNGTSRPSDGLPLPPMPSGPEVPMPVPMLRPAD